MVNEISRLFKKDFKGKTLKLWKYRGSELRNQLQHS